MNSHTTPKDFFLHVGATVALYIVAGSLINLAFSIINYFNPDTLAGYFYGGSVVWSISMLVVLVPVLYAIEWVIARDIAHTPAKRDLWIRRWRIFLTIFLAGILMIGDLITLINTYLSGEITSRFVYKIIVVILVAGAIGKYYFFDLNNKHRFAHLAKRLNAWIGALLVIAAIVTGFLVVGSPAKQRALRFDQQRINDLSSIQSTLLYNSWQAKGVLPLKLDELKDSLSGTIIPVDPETGAPYGYTKVASTTFKVCATFALPSQDTKGRGGYGYRDVVSSSVYYPGFEGEQWKHEAGLVCFDRTIDTKLYPVTGGTLVPPEAKL